MRFGSLADKDSRDWIARSMPIPDIALSLFLRLRLRDIPRSVNEKLRGWTKGSVLQCDDTDGDVA